MTMRSVRMACLAVAIPMLSAAQRPASLTAELDSATSVAVQREVVLASEKGLPTEPLLAKAREGRLKRAPGQRIRLAVAALSARLDSARRALGPDATADELVAGADALAAGARPDALRAVRAASAQRSAILPLGALTQLVASGVSSRRAMEMIVDLLRRNVAPARLVAFGNAVEMDVASGLPPDEAALFRLRAASAASANAAALGVPSDVQPVPSPPPATSPRRRP